jgi:hypothetical protein
MAQGKKNDDNDDNYVDVYKNKSMDGILCFVTKIPKTIEIKQIDQIG